MLSNNLLNLKFKPQLISLIYTKNIFNNRCIPKGTLPLKLPEKPIKLHFFLLSRMNVARKTARILRCSFRGDAIRCHLPNTIHSAVFSTRFACMCDDSYQFDKFESGVILDVCITPHNMYRTRASPS